MKLKSSVVIKEASNDVIFALSLEATSEEFFKFEGVSAEALRFVDKRGNFELGDLVSFVAGNYPDVDQGTITADMRAFCDLLVEHKFLA